MSVVNVSRVLLLTAAALMMLPHGRAMAASPAHKASDRKGVDAKGVDAKAAKAGEISQNLRIRRVDWEGVNGLVRPPEFEFMNIPKSATRVRDWGQVRVQYDTFPEWIDQLVIKYHVLLVSKDKQAEKSYSLMETSVAYVDIRKGNGHTSTVHLRPNTLEKYGEVVAVGVEILFGEEEVRFSDSSSQARLSKEAMASGWWNAIRSDEKVAVRDGYLLERAKTPFALVNYSDFEAVRE